MATKAGLSGGANAWRTQQTIRPEESPVSIAVQLLFNATLRIDEPLPSLERTGDNVQRCDLSIVYVYPAVALNSCAEPGNV